MRNSSPIYHLLHREIKACADQLLAISQKEEFSTEKDGGQILGKLNELQEFAVKMRSEEHYHQLSSLKSYLDNTMLRYQDEKKRLLTMRLSEAVSLLGSPPEPGVTFKPSIVRSLMTNLIRHFFEEVKPGRPLFLKLNEIRAQMAY